ncbi:MAG: DMT family transporter [Chloroflexota bacterium]
MQLNNQNPNHIAPVNSDQQPGKYNAYLVLGIGILALVLSPLFIRWADAPGVITSFYRMLITSTILAPFAVPKLKKIKSQLTLRVLVFPVVAGIFSGLDHFLWSTAVEKTTVANATLLNNISPLWVALFAIIFLKERLGFRFWIGLVSVLAGASAVLGSTIFLRPNFVTGDLLAISSSIFYGGFFLATQKGRDNLDVLPALWIMTVVNALTLLIITQLLGLPLTGYTQTTYLTFLTAALISQLGAYYCITYALGNIPASVVTPSMVAQPVLTALLAIPLAKELLTTWQIIGGLVTLGGIYLVNTSKRR